MLKIINAKSEEKLEELLFSDIKEKLASLRSGVPGTDGMAAAERKTAKQIVLCR